MPAQLEVVSSGVPSYEAIESSHTSWAVVIDNPNREAAVDVRAHIVLRDAAGAVVSEEDVTIPTLLPGRSGWAKEQVPGELRPGPAGVAAVEVALTPSRWVAVQDQRLTVSDVRMTEDGFVDRVSAVVDSSFGSPMPAQAIAVFRDDAGSILGGFRQPIEPLGHGEVSIEIESRETIEGVAGVEVYLVPDALT